MNPNREQQIVIEELDENILLLASAGTGKTNTLARRIVNILDSGRATAEEILCLTFTNKGSREIKAAVQRELGAKANHLYMGTFHSFCLQILRAEGKNNSDFYQDILIYDEEDAVPILTEFMDKKWASIEPFALFNAVAYIKEERANLDFLSENRLEDYKNTLAAIMANKEKKESLMKKMSYRGHVSEEYFMKELAGKFPNLIAQYELRLAENHAVDFTDLIVQTYRLFKDEEVVEKWRKQYRYISIDEAQDTSIVEYKVLRKLFPGNTILLCGDFFQTIYTWRGSSPEELLDRYEADCHPKVVTFLTNYRSSALLFETGFGTLEKMFPKLVEKTYKTRPQSAHALQGDPVVIVSTDSRGRAADAIYQKILKLYEEADAKGEERPSTAVLVRRNLDAEDFSKKFIFLRHNKFKDNRLQFYLVDDVKFYKKMEIKDILAFFKIIVNRHDTASAKRIIEKFAPGIGKATVDKIESDECRKTGIRLCDFLNIQNYVKDLFDDLVESLEDENIIVFDVESTGVDTTSDEIIQIAAIRINAKGEELERFERFIKPQGSVGESEKVHHFSDEFLAEKGEPAPVVLEAFRKFSENATIVGHNVQFDISILASELKRNHLPEAKFKAVYDTLDLYRRYYPNEKNHKLEHLSERFETKHKPSHNALDDILATAELLVQIVQEQVIPTRDSRLAYMRMKSEFATFASVISTLWKKSFTEKPTELLEYIMNHLKLKQYYMNMGLKVDLTPQKRKEREDGNMVRLENIRELYLIFQELEEELLYIEEDELGYQKTLRTDISMRDVLQRILDISSLTSGEMDPRRKGKKRIPIITVHQSKGAEFDYVFLAGMEKGVFPHYIAELEGNIMEECRLFYVAITRPKKGLFIFYSTWGDNNKQRQPSPFLDDLPKKYCVEVRY